VGLKDTISFFWALSSKIFPIESFTTCEKEDLCRAYCHYAKSNMSAMIKSIFSDITYSSVPTPYPTGLLIHSSTYLREIFLWRGRFNHSVLFQQLILEMFLQSLNTYWTDTILEPFSKQNTHWEILSWEPGQKGLHRCVYSIPSECSRSYNGETGRLWAVRLIEHRQNA